MRAVLTSVIVMVYVAAAVTALRPGIASAQPASMIEEDFTAGGLAGTFTRPSGRSTRGPVALLIAGSGPTPRDGTIGTYRLIAEGLAKAGIRSYRYDKRGVGGSRALFTRGEDVVFGTFLDYALAVV